MTSCTAKPTDTDVDEQSGMILKNADNEMAVIIMRVKMASQSTTLRDRSKQLLRVREWKNRSDERRRNSKRVEL